MKSFSVFFAVVLFASSAKAQKVQTPKTYTVSLTKEQWLSVLGNMDSCNRIVQESDIPVRKANFILQSYSTLYQTVSLQVGAQIQAEEKAAADTTKPKNPKK